MWKEIPSTIKNTKFQLITGIIMMELTQFHDKTWVLECMPFTRNHHLRSKSLELAQKEAVELIKNIIKNYQESISNIKGVNYA